jgi:hypothetical protein
MWIVVEKISTERDSALKDDAQLYLAYSVWVDKNSHNRNEPPIYTADCLISERALPDTVTRFAKDAQGNYLLRRGGSWSESEYAAEYRAYREGKRENPNADLATETVPLDIVDKIKTKYILRHLENVDAAGKLSGENKNKAVREKEQPAPKDKAEKSELKSLLGVGFELLLEREKKPKAEKESNK